MSRIFSPNYVRRVNGAQGAYGGGAEEREQPADMFLPSTSTLYRTDGTRTGRRIGSPHGARQAGADKLSFEPKISGRIGSLHSPEKISFQPKISGREGLHGTDKIQLRPYPGGQGRNGRAGGRGDPFLARMDRAARRGNGAGTGAGAGATPGSGAGTGAAASTGTSTGGRLEEWSGGHRWVTNEDRTRWKAQEADAKMKHEAAMTAKTTAADARSAAGAAQGAAEAARGDAAAARQRAITASTRTGVGGAIARAATRSVAGFKERSAASLEADAQAKQAQATRAEGEAARLNPPRAPSYINNQPAKQAFADLYKNEAARTQGAYDTARGAAQGTRNLANSVTASGFNPLNPAGPALTAVGMGLGKVAQGQEALANRRQEQAQEAQLKYQRHNAGTGIGTGPGGSSISSGGNGMGQGNGGPMQTQRAAPPPAQTFPANPQQRAAMGGMQGAAQAQAQGQGQAQPQVQGAGLPPGMRARGGGGGLGAGPQVASASPAAAPSMAPAPAGVAAAPVSLGGGGGGGGGSAPISLGGGGGGLGGGSTKKKK